MVYSNEGNHGQYSPQKYEEPQQNLTCCLWQWYQSNNEDNRVKLKKNWNSIEWWEVEFQKTLVINPKSWNIPEKKSIFRKIQRPGEITARQELKYSCAFINLLYIFTMPTVKEVEELKKTHHQVISHINDLIENLSFFFEI